jgi:uncharacterized protein
VADGRIPVGALPPGYPARARSFSSAIFYFLTSERDSFSALHRLRADEVYHFYLGDAVGMLQLDPDGSSRHVILGTDILSGQQVQTLVPHGVWQGSHLMPGGSFALLGCTVAPAFEQSDFEAGSKEILSAQYPHERDLIAALTRV